ncbi:MAG: hypothetical protein HY554_01150 [Elusimicrobia bacterium]|nr:hypothetical protein [Elusimicrobiota bacterium]
MRTGTKGTGRARRGSVGRVAAALLCLAVSAEAAPSLTDEGAWSQVGERFHEDGGLGRAAVEAGGRAQGPAAPAQTARALSERMTRSPLPVPPPGADGASPRLPAWKRAARAVDGAFTRAASLAAAPFHFGASLVRRDVEPDPKLSVVAALGIVLATTAGAAVGGPPAALAAHVFTSIIAGALTQAATIRRPAAPGPGR